jgi:hypothetical protein
MLFIFRHIPRNLADCFIDANSETKFFSISAYCLRKVMIVDNSMFVVSKLFTVHAGLNGLPDSLVSSPLALVVDLKYKTYRFQS